MSVQFFLTTQYCRIMKSKIYVRRTTYAISIELFLSEQKYQVNSVYPKPNHKTKNLWMFPKIFDPRSLNIRSICRTEHFQRLKGGGKTKNFYENTWWVSKSADTGALSLKLYVNFVFENLEGGKQGGEIENVEKIKLNVDILSTNLLNRDRKIIF